MGSQDGKPAHWRPGIRKAPPAKEWPRMRGGDVARYGIEPMLSLTEAAAELGVSEDTMRKRVLDGTLPAFKLAGRWKTRRSDLADQEDTPESQITDVSFRTDE